MSLDKQNHNRARPKSAIYTPKPLSQLPLRQIPTNQIFPFTNTLQTKSASFKAYSNSNQSRSSFEEQRIDQLRNCIEEYEKRIEFLEAGIVKYWKFYEDDRDVAREAAEKGDFGISEIFAANAEDHRQLFQSYTAKKVQLIESVKKFKQELQRLLTIKKE